MRMTRLFVIIFSVFLALQNAVAQDKTTVELVDEIGEATTGEALLSSLDRFALQLQERKAKGLIIYYRSDDKINNHFIWSSLKTIGLLDLSVICMPW